MRPRPEPSTTAAEHEMLTGWLDWHRNTLLQKLEGVSEDDARRPMVASGTTLLGIAKHLAYVERWWFGSIFAGQDLDFPWTDDDPDADWRPEQHERSEDILGLYEREIARSREIVAAAASLDELSARTSSGPQGSERFNLRWILIHMMQETARHNGHADILRENLDGSTGT